MQINRIQSYNNNIKSNNNKNVAFKGAPVDGLVKFFEVVAKGGAPGEFLMQDVAACGLPRTVSSLNRNKEKLGHLNYLAAGETAIREVLTGSSTMVVPALVLLAGSKAVGKANNVSIASIKDYGDSMINVAKTVDIKSPELRQEFYTDVFKKIGDNLGKKDGELTDFASTLAKKAIEMEKAPKKSAIKRLLGEQAKDVVTKDKIMDEITDFFVKAKKSSVDKFDTDFLSAKISKNNSDSIDSVVKSLKNYADDFTSKAIKTKAKNPADFIKEFGKIRTGSRFVTGIATVALTGLFMIIIPKLYTLSKTNPEGNDSNNQPQANGEAK